MKIIGFAAQGLSNFDARKHMALIANNHSGPISVQEIADGVDLVVSHLDLHLDSADWVDLTLMSPYFISKPQHFTKNHA